MISAIEWSVVLGCVVSLALMIVRIVRQPRPRPAETPVTVRGVGWAFHQRRLGFARRDQVYAAPMSSPVLDAPAVAPRRIGGLPVRRLVRDISSVLMISGLLLVLDAGLTLVWQEPVTAVIGLIQRSQINKQYLSFQTAPLTPVERHVIVTLPKPQDRIAYLARREQHQVATGDAIGHISIPKIGASYDVVAGNRRGQPREGSGPLPGDRLPRPGADGRDRRSPHHLPGAVPPSRRAQAGRPDRPEDALRPVHLRRRVPQDRPAHCAVGHATTSATSAWCCPPATRSTAPRSGSSSSRG